MKTFFYMGRNLQNKSKVSWKIWKIEREGRLVTVQCGPSNSSNGPYVRAARSRARD